ncbi:MAG: helix-turn-helix domain-containing protein [Candidatus Nanoarchaeia archaeon]
MNRPSRKRGRAKAEITITSVKKHKEFNRNIETSKLEFNKQKTLQLFKKGLNVKQIAQKRDLKEGKIWAYMAKLLDDHQLRLKQVLSNEKSWKILSRIKPGQ